jgi:hypothetical protein
MSPNPKILYYINHALAAIKSNDSGDVVNYLTLALALAKRWSDENEN